TFEAVKPLGAGVKPKVDGAAVCQRGTILRWRWRRRRPRAMAQALKRVEGASFPGVGLASAFRCTARNVTKGATCTPQIFRFYPLGRGEEGFLPHTVLLGELKEVRAPMMCARKGALTLSWNGRLPPLVRDGLLASL